MPVVKLQKNIPDFNNLPAVLFNIITKFLESEESSALAWTNKSILAIIHLERLAAIFSERVGSGMEKRAEKLLKLLKRDEDRQYVLLRVGELTDNADRTFRCPPYVYSFWAKDKHMCLMQEKYMSAATKKVLLQRCRAIEEHKLAYTQPLDRMAPCTFHQYAHLLKNESLGQVIEKKMDTKVITESVAQYEQLVQRPYVKPMVKNDASAHFDFTPIKEALRRGIDDYASKWRIAPDLPAMKIAWMQIGMAQRDFPAHVIQEYCWKNRRFFPKAPEFNEKKMLRTETCCSEDNKPQKVALPFLFFKGEGLGESFALTHSTTLTWAVASRNMVPEYALRSDLAAITRLDEVRTEDCKQLLANLEKPEKSRCCIS